MKIRHVEPTDVEAVASLWQYWFRDKTREPEQGLVELARRVYFENPHTHDEVRSLVAVDEAGAVLGFLGVTVTPVIVDGREGLMAGVFPSVVDPDAPTTVAAFLLRKFLSGPQDFTFSDGGHVKFERIWELLGGRILQLQSMRWMKVLRPSSVALQSLIARSRVAANLAGGLRYLSGGGDALLRVLARSRLTTGGLANAYEVEPLTPKAMEEMAPRILGSSRLRPSYGEAQVSWQFEEMAKIASQGEFRARLVRTDQGAPVGWFVYYLNRGGVSRVYNIEARAPHMGGILETLFLEADRDGAGALIGRMEPRLRSDLRRLGTLVYNGGSLLMAHSRDGTLVDDAELGRLAFSRLQGENWYWWAIDG